MPFFFFYNSGAAGSKVARPSGKHLGWLAGWLGLQYHAIMPKAGKGNKRARTNKLTLTRHTHLNQHFLPIYGYLTITWHLSKQSFSKYDTNFNLKFLQNLLCLRLFLADFEAVATAEKEYKCLTRILNHFPAFNNKFLPARAQQALS